MPSSPPSTPFPLSSPSRDTPNAHPYAIKTSSSAVLTRSNSTGNRNDASHHYTPLSPSRNALAAKQSRYMQSHRHTKSLSATNEDADASPLPMPIPPSASVPVRLANQLYINGGQAIVSDGEGIPPTPPMTWRIKRSETLPSVLPSKSDAELSVQDLPKNSKVWTASQLSTYLSSSLRLKGGAKLPVPVARDIAAFVLKEHLSGRAFLRMKKEDYDNLGLNQLWKDALLDASRALRQNLVQGRIMGFGSGSPLSPLSAEEMLFMQEEDAPSADLPAYSTFDPTHRRVPSSTPLQWEEDKKRMSKTSFRAGRVRGMVETYERSFSESSASGSDCDDHESEDNLADFGKPGSRRLVGEPEEDEGGFASGEMTSTSENETDNAFASGSAVPGLLLSPTSPPDADSRNPLTPPIPQGADIAEDSPSIEALLHEQEQSGLKGKQYKSWGAKAWEDEVDDPTGVHATARRVPIAHTTTKGLFNTEAPSNVAHVSALPPIQSAPRGLVGLFTQPESEEPLPRTTKDASVGNDAEVEKEALQAPAPAPTVYETLEVFQRRLEVVENRLKEMERKDEEREQAEQAKAEAEAERRHRDALEKVSVKHRNAGIRRHLPRAFDILYPGESKDKERQVKNYSGADPSLSGLPRYMLFISLGVIAVTFRVMLRRMIGGRKRG